VTVETQPEKQPETPLITEPQLRKVNLLLNSAGITNRDDALAWLSGVLGRDITSLTNLLSQTYKYEVEKLPLGSTLSNRDVTTRVGDFVRCNGSAATLLVLYYVGQSKPSPRPGELPVWTSYVSLRPRQS